MATWNSTFQLVILLVFINQSTLSLLRLKKCELSGSISKVPWGNLPDLFLLDLSSNKLSGNVPDSLGYLGNLRSLNLRDNSIVGPLPTSIGNLSRLEDLDLSLNMMDGIIPESIGKLANLYSLNLEGNSWKGVITENHLQNLTKLEHLYLSSKSKSLVFNVKQDWMESFSLYTLEIIDCQLGPAFPSWLRTQGPLPLWSNSKAISLKSNLISGPIPLNIGHEMTKLIGLELSKNVLNGSIPPSMTEMKDLLFLDLSSNYLSRAIPPNWQSLKRLNYMDLSNNSLSGGIPRSICSLPSLEWLKLSNNNLSEELSLSLQDCTAGLSYLDLGGNRFFGTIPPIVENLFNMSYLGLRSNMLIGDIPEQFCQFPNLHILDLAHNNLPGAIPRCLGNLEALKSMVTYNGSAKSPYLSLSFTEHLEMVVKGRQKEYFQTFNDPSIYEGNAYLYGLPLTSNCSAADLGDAKDKNDEASSEKFWLYVGTAMGFIIGFWSICGTLINKRSWRRAYFMFLDETKDRLYVIIAVSVARFKRMAALARI
ncbi:hypothetical protein JRO89_XS05G0112300 [Xanthoceras sorbifolium]|uniref:Disease resistance R13L4/SHOC-2-like LRR domain-containing protein n=1 Tax=Xanthoceras sorbifolium TaxID=99658 RepID=A0ABQ8I226_9ROSI|nr:hypothetical protein JRO89_XS05G0112300 [Xanthoceras sorbifolium]